MELTTIIPSFGNLLMTVAAFVVALSIIVAVHEFGHYIVARWCRIHSEVFSVGFGPRLWSRVDKRGTRWQVAAIPLGGYVKFLGDANAASAGADEATMARLSPEERRHTIHGAPLWARALTVAAGPVFNFILSMIVFAALFVVSGAPADRPTVGAVHPLPGGTGSILPGDVIVAVEGIATPDNDALAEAIEKAPAAPVMSYTVERSGGTVTVEGPVLYPARVAGVQAGSAAYDAGLDRGEVIVAADGTTLTAFADLQAYVKAAEGRPMRLTVWKPDGTTRDVTLAPRITDQPLPDGGFETRYLIGIAGDFFYEPTTRAVGPVEAVSAAGRQVWFIASSSLSAIGHIVTGAISPCAMRGAITIAETSGAAASSGLYDFVFFIAVLSTAVGLLNLFPVPMLDGGHLVFHAWEWARGRPPPEAVMNVLTTIGFAFVIFVMVFGLSNDILCP